MPTAERARREQLEHQAQAPALRRHPLTVRNDLFIDAYIRCGNSHQAAIAAGYSKETAASDAYRLLKKPHIRAALEERRARFVAEVQVTAADVLRELTALAFHDPASIYDGNGDLIPVSLWPQRTRQAIVAMEIVTKNAAAGDNQVDRVLKVRFESKSKPLELLARHLAMLIDRREIGAPGAFNGLSDAELAQRIHQAAGRLARLAAGPAIDVTPTDSATDSAGVPADSPSNPAT